MRLADRKSPRINLRKFRHKIVSKDLYIKWKDLHPEYTVSLVEFKRIWKLIAQELQIGTVEETEGVLLPHGIGELYVGYVKTKDRIIDYNLSRIHNTTVYHENYHSYGKTGKIIYSPCGKYQLRNCDLWNFTPITPYRKRVTKALVENPERYKNSRQKNYYGRTNNRPVNIPDTQSGEDCQ